MYVSDFHTANNLLSKGGSLPKVVLGFGGARLNPIRESAASRIKQPKSNTWPSKIHMTLL